MKESIAKECLKALQESKDEKIVITKDNGKVIITRCKYKGEEQNDTKPTINK